jgi:hypothetical protein
LGPLVLSILAVPLFHCSRRLRIRRADLEQGGVDLPRALHQPEDGGARDAHLLGDLAEAEMGLGQPPRLDRLRVEAIDMDPRRLPARGRQPHLAAAADAAGEPPRHGKMQVRAHAVVRHVGTGKGQPQHRVGERRQRTRLRRLDQQHRLAAAAQGAQPVGQRLPARGDAAARPHQRRQPVEHHQVGTDHERIERRHPGLAAEVGQAGALRIAGGDDEMARRRIVAGDGAQARLQQPLPHRRIDMDDALRAGRLPFHQPAAARRRIGHRQRQPALAHPARAGEEGDGAAREYGRKDRIGRRHVVEGCEHIRRPGAQGCGTGRRGRAGGVGHLHERVSGNGSAGAGFSPAGAHQESKRPPAFGAARAWFWRGEVNTDSAPKSSPSRPHRLQFGRTDPPPISYATQTRRRRGGPPLHQDRSRRRGRSKTGPCVRRKITIPRPQTAFCAGLTRASIAPLHHEPADQVRETHILLN